MLNKIEEIIATVYLLLPPEQDSTSTGHDGSFTCEVLPASVVTFRELFAYSSLCFTASMCLSLYILLSDG